MNNSWIVLFFLPAVGFAGGAVGNGGDTVECTHSETNSFDGTYALDYLLTYKESNQNVDIVPIKTLEESAQRIKKVFQEKVPELSDSFDEFIKLVRSEDITLPRFWEESPFGLVDIKDEDIINMVPMNCRQNGAVKIVQTVIRLNPLKTGLEKYKLIYKFVPSIFQALYIQEPLQLSFLLVHEWLWDLSHNVERNRRLNRFIHSKDFESLPREQLRTKLTTLGLEIPKEISPEAFRFDSCEASPPGANLLMSRIDHKTPIILSQNFSLLQRKFACPFGDGADGCLLSTLHWYQIDLGGKPTLTGAMNEQGEKFLYFKSVKFGTSTCRVDQEIANIRCTNISPYPLPPKPTLNGTIGSGCIRFYNSEFFQGIPYSELFESVLTLKL